MPAAKQSSSCKTWILGGVLVLAGSAIVVACWVHSARLVEPPGLTAVADARTIASAAQMHLASDEHAQCPTVDALIREHQLDRAKNAVDPWGKTFVIRCFGSAADPHVEVRSAGADGRFDTGDDVASD